MVNKKIQISLLLAALALVCLAIPTLAVPPLPSSFYGAIEENGQNIPDGTRVQVLIGGKVYAATNSQTYQGRSVYSLDVPGDDAATPEIEGGKEGDIVQFTVGGRVASQTGVWHGGTNTIIDLTPSPHQIFLPAVRR